MLRGVFALFFRSLRSDARSLWVHASWLLLLIVIYLGMWSAQAQSAFYGAPGLTFFRTVIFTNAVFVTLLGISYFSSAISEEKEEDTLGLMTMAGISPLGILLGKSTTRLFQAMLLLAVQYPFTLLAITLGGLMPDQIYAAYAALLAYTILLSNVGLLCSVLCRRNRDAAGLTTLWMVGYVFTPILALLGLELVKSPTQHRQLLLFRILEPLTPVLGWISQTNVFSALIWATETGYQFKLTPQLVSNSMGGILLFFLSWWLFGIVSHDPASEATTRAMVPRKTSRLGRFSAGRTWDRALVWKDFHFTAGGWFGIVARCGLYVGLYWLTFLASYPWSEPVERRVINWWNITWGYQIFVVPLFVVDCAMCLSRLFQEEIRHQTLAALLMLPRSVSHIVYSKLGGCLVGLLPGMVAVYVAFFWLMDNKNNLAELLKQPSIWWIAANLLLVIHLSAMLSTYLRWGAFALSLALTIGSMFVTISLPQFAMGVGGPNQIHPDTIMGLLTIPVLVACALCHFVVLLRIPALGEK